MENSFAINEGILLVKSKEDRIEDGIMGRRPVILGDTILDTSSKLNSIEVEALLDDHFSGNDVISKQIIVEKMDDFIGEGQFEDLSVVNSNPLHEQEFHSENGNITIVPDVFCNSVGETHIISDNDGEIETVQTSFFQDNHNLEEVTSEMTSKLVSETESYSKTAEIRIKEEPSESKECTVEFEVNSLPSKQNDPSPSSSLPHVRKPKISKSTRDKQQIRIDKDDPRCRLHFVKFMKKDGKTIKIWECGICGKEFIHQYTLMRHLPTHTDERNYKCKHCGKAFRQMSTLAQHKATHSEFRPYVCDVCQKTFSRVSTLISHKKIHTESKPHVCHICGKGFHQKGNLKNHFFTHTNERPYKCDVCGRGFNQSSNLQCHKLKTHLQKGNFPQLVNNKYKCPNCPESFSRRAQLRHHEEYVHDIKNVFSCKSSLRPSLIPSRNSVLKKKKMGNIRIIQMPPGDSMDEDKIPENGLRLPSSIHKTGILIDPIDTKAMHKTLSQGLTPFALLKPAKSSPVVVKVQLCDGSKHMLVPASASELKLAGKFSVTSQLDGNRTVQIKVPVVATIHQRVDENGEVHMDVEPPSDEETDNTNEKSIMVNNQPNSVEQPLLPNLISSTINNRNSTIVQHFIINPSVVKPFDAHWHPPRVFLYPPEEDASGRRNCCGNKLCLLEFKDNLLPEETGEGDLEGIPLGLAPSEGIGYMIPSQVNTQLIEISPSQQASVDLLATAVNLTNESPMKEVDMDSSVQYLRPTENLGEYEVIEPDDRTFFTNSHSVLQQLKPLLDENEPVTVDQSHLTALMSVLQTEGYELQTDEESTAHQIILNSVDDAIIVDNQHVQMVINDQQELDSVDVSSMQVQGVDSSSLSFGVQDSQ